MLAVLDLPTRQAIGSTVGNVGGGLAGHGQDLHAVANAFPDLLPDLGNVSLALANNDGRDFASLLRSSSELAASFKDRQRQIGQLLGKMDRTFAGFNTEDGNGLAATLKTAPDALCKARGALDSLNAPLRSTALAARKLRPCGEDLGTATPDVRGFLVDSRSPLDQVPGVSEDAQPALADLGDTFDRVQPFSPMLGRGFGRAGALAQIVSPFAPEGSLFFTNATKALREGNDNYHWLNVIADTNATENVFNGVGAPIRDPF